MGKKGGTQQPSVKDGFTKEPDSKYLTKKVSTYVTTNQLPIIGNDEKVASARKGLLNHIAFLRKRYDNNRDVWYEDYRNGKGDWNQKNLSGFLVEDVATQLMIDSLKGQKIYFTVALCFQKPSFLGKFFNLDSHSAIQLHNQQKTVGLQIGLQSAGVLVVENWRKKDPKTNKVFYTYTRTITRDTAEKVFAEILKDMKREYIYKRVANPKQGTINCTTWLIKICDIAGYKFKEFDDILWELSNNPYSLHLRLKGRMKKEEWEFHRYAKQPE